MKNRIFALVYLATIIVGVVSIVFPQTGHAATSNDATKVCQSIYSGSNQNQLANDCATAYTQEKSVESGSKKGAQSKNSLCNNQLSAVGLDKTACAAGWDAAALGLTASDADYAGNIAKTCKKYLGNQSTLDGCMAGYKAGVSNSSSSVCNSYRDLARANAKTACKTAFSAGQAQYKVIQANKKTTDNSNATVQLDCDAQSDNPLTWIVCPVIDLLASLVDGIDSIITNQLSIETNDIFCSTKDSPCEAYYTAWKTFRNIALGLMVIAGLIILISQALGMEILDAYTIRKTLPRLLVAAVGITLSWSLMEFAVQLTNDLGYGIRHLIYAPFLQLGDKINLDFGGSITNLIFGGLIAGGTIAGATAATGVGAAGFALTGGLGALLAYAGTAALAVLVAVIVLILREIAIIMMIILAPIAIVAYILPNTQKAYKLWWESFSKALLMFPLIAAFIATGRVFSAIALSSGGVINQIIGFIAYFAPYFLLPMTFVMAGGFVKQLGGFVNDRGQGAFKRLGDFRANRRKAGFQRIQKGELYRNAPEGSRRQRVGRGWQAASLFNPDEISANPRRWGAQARALRERADVINAQKAFEAEEFLPIKGDDDTSQAAIRYGREGRESAYAYLEAKGFAKDDIEQKLAHIDQLRKKFGAPAFNQAAIMSAVTSSTAYLKDPVTGEKEGIGELLNDIEWASGGNDQVRAQLIGKVKSLAPQAGRGDLAAPFSDMYKQARLIGAAKPEQRRQAIATANEVLTDTIAYTEGAGYAMGGKAAALENIIPAYQRRLEKTSMAVSTAETNMDALSRGETVFLRDEKGDVIKNADGTDAVLTEEMAYEQHDTAVKNQKRALAATASLHDVVGQVSEEKAALVAELVLGTRMPNDTSGRTVLQKIDSMGGDSEFLAYRNDYGRRYKEGMTKAELEARQAQSAQGTMNGPQAGLPTNPLSP